MPVRAFSHVPLLGLLLLAGCHSTPTEPTAAGPDGRTYVPLNVNCLMAPELACAVTRFGQGDLTAQAEWYATDVIYGTTADPAVTFPRPGVPVASRPVKLYIAARIGTETRASSLSYDMAPGTRPIPLAALVGFTYEGDTGFNVLEGVRIEVLGNESVAGASTVTGAGGFYQLWHMRIGVPFTMRASKPGYTSVDVPHPGIRIAPEGFPDVATSAQHFRLNRQP